MYGTVELILSIIEEVVLFGAKVHSHSMAWCIRKCPLYRHALCSELSSEVPLCINPVNLLGTFLLVCIAIFICQDVVILHALLLCIIFSLLYARFTLPILGDVSAVVVQCSRATVITIQLAFVNLQYSPKEISDFDKNACIRSC